MVDPCLGIEDLSDISMLTTYPNPTDGVFNVEFNVANSHDIVVSILDVTGKTMQSQELENFTGAYKNQFDLSDKANGFYLIQINVDGQPLNQKIIVQ